MLMSMAALAGGVSWWLSGRLSNQGSWVVVLDQPNDRSLHHIPTPRTGGLAIMIGVFAAVGIAACFQSQPWSSEEPELFGWSSLGWIMAVMAILASVSFLDDRRGLPIAVRFGVQFVAAAVLIFGTHLSLLVVPIPRVGAIELGWFSGIGAIAFLIWMTNLYNFMDGMDGFAGGMTVIGGLALASVGANSHVGTVSFLALLMAGAAAGFLLHNFPPARIFMGDVGSIPIGFCFGALMLLGSHEHVFDLWVPLIIFSPFIVDATVTLLRRALAGEKVWEAHRSHYYQRVVLLGWGHRRTVLIEYVVMLACAVLGWLYQIGSDWLRLGVLLGWGLMFVGLMVGVRIAERTVREKQHAA